MNERLFNQPERERTETEAKQFEAACIANVVGQLYEAFRGEISGREVGDWALDDLHDLCTSLAKRDPEMGAYLLDALGSHKVASTEPDPTDAIRKVLGLPVPDYVALAQAAQEVADGAPSQPDHASPPPSEHRQ